MNAKRLFMLIATFSMVGRTIVLGQPPTDFANLAPTVIRHAELNPDVPIFVPVHPRIATTISFPRAIGEPLGTGFVDAEALGKPGSTDSKTPASAKGEYVIDYEQGDTFFTVQPTVRSELLNLNVPYEGATIVFYFYPVQSPLSALASLILQEKSTATKGAHIAHEEKSRAGELSVGPGSEAMNPNPAGVPVPPALAKPEDANMSEGSGPTLPAEDRSAARIQKTETLPAKPFLPATPARLDGFLRKLRMVHAAQLGSELSELASALKVTVAVSSVETADAPTLLHPVNDSGLYQLILLRAVRDSALDAVGFVVLMRNTSDQNLVFDPRTFSARCGAARYVAQVIDAPATLKPRETLAAYFAIVGAGDGRPGYLEAENDWRISVALISPRVSPGGSLASEREHLKEAVSR